MHSPAGKGFSHGNRHQLQVGAITTLSCTFLLTWVWTQLWFPIIQDSLYVAFSLPPQSFHLVLKSITQSRALIQLKNTHKNQGMETGKGAMGRECSELLLPWSHNPDVLGLLSSYQDEDWAAWHIRLNTAIKHKCLLTKTAFALRR